MLISKVPNDLTEIRKFEIVISTQFNRYTEYINNLVDKKQKFNFLFHHTMMEFYKEINELNINREYTEYTTYILDALKDIPVHNQYLRYLKLKKINDLNDTKN